MFFFRDSFQQYGALLFIYLDKQKDHGQKGNCNISVYLH